MVTGLVSPTECEVKRPMRSLDEMGSSLLDPRVSLPGKACPAGSAAQAGGQCPAPASPSSRVPLCGPAGAAAPLTLWPPPHHQEIITMLD
jgi:hypothetical protein